MWMWQRGRSSLAAVVGFSLARASQKGMQSWGLVESKAVSVPVQNGEQKGLKPCAARFWISG